MATKLTEEEQDALIEQYKGDSKGDWRKKVTKLIRENPAEYKILEMGKSSSHQTHLTVTQFSEALPSLKSSLIDCIFKDIDEIDDQQGDGKLKITTIVRWVNNKKRVKEKIIIKDENWLYEKLKKMQFNHLDIDENGTLDREEIHEEFDKEVDDPNIIDIIFDVIDANGDGDISVKEWFQWQQKFKRKDLKKLFAKYQAPATEEAKDEEPQEEPKEEEAPAYEPEEPKEEPKEEEPKEEPKKDYDEDVGLEADADDAVVVAPSGDMTDNPKGKTNSWSREKSVEMEFDYYDETDAKNDPNADTTDKTYNVSVTPSYPPAPSGELYIRSPTSKWRACEVSEVLEDGAKWKIHYKGFNNKYDEIVESNSDRLRLDNPGNVVPKRKSTKKVKGKAVINVQEEKRIWCESSNNPNIHRECVICQEKGNKYKLHFISYHEKYDIWIEKDSKRLQKNRPRGDVLLKGDNLSCYSTKFNGWLEVEVIKCNNHEDRVQVAWVGSNNLDPIWLPANDPKLSIKHKKHDAPAP